MKIWYAFLLLIISFATSRANNLQISTPSINSTNHLVFTVSWENSWRTNSAPNNWDGVYLFAKYRDCASTQAWNHIEFSTTYTEHSVGSPLEIHNYLLDGKGIIIRPASIGSGTISSVTVRLKMTTPANNTNYDIKIFGIEMVYIPTGPFYLGDGNSTFSFKEGGTVNSPLLIQNDDGLTSGFGAGQLSSLNLGSAPYSIPAAFPLGYDSVYVMKYEISQGQWVSFLNTLSNTQASARFLASSSNRINVTGAWPTYTTITPHRAMGKLSWKDVLAFLDWCALRPMTETEYEKICRGPNIPISGEFAWGTNLFSPVTSIANDGTPTETNGTTAPIGYGKANINSTQIGPLRNGFAATASSNRLQAGASYYGVMEMSGNIRELCIGVSYSQGISFDATHGDGYLTSTTPIGEHDVSTWPINFGATWRGGDFSGIIGNSSVSNRIYYSLNTVARSAIFGGRGIR